MAGQQLRNDSRNRSLDDVLEEERPGKLARDVEQEPLPEDNDSPAAPARNLHASSTPEDHPLTDFADQDQAYEEGSDPVEQWV